MSMLAPTAEPARAPKALKMPLHTLIVEDDPLSRDSLGTILRKLGHTVATTGTLAGGFDELRREDPLPTCLLLDLMLPDGSGAELLQRIRHDKLPIRVAVMTGAFDPVVLQRITSLHPDALFYKPLDVPKLTAWLKSCGRAE